MWGAIKSFFVKIVWPSTAALFNRLTPIVAETAVKLAYNKASEIKGKVGKSDRRKVEKELINDLKAQGLMVGVDFALGEIEDAAKLAVKKADER
jgi:hypothetical protein